MIDRKALEEERDMLAVKVQYPPVYGVVIVKWKGRIKEIDALLAAPRPRALHKLDLRPGDVVRLDAWQDGRLSYVGDLHTINYSVTLAIDCDGRNFPITSGRPKGSRPLFVIVSRAEVAPSVEHLTAELAAAHADIITLRECAQEEMERADAQFEAGVRAALAAAAKRIEVNETPCSPVYPTAWTDDQISHYETGQRDAASSFTYAIRTLDPAKIARDAG